MKNIIILILIPLLGFSQEECRKFAQDYEKFGDKGTVYKIDKRYQETDWLFNSIEGIKLDGESYMSQSIQIAPQKLKDGTYDDLAYIVDDVQVQTNEIGLYPWESITYRDSIFQKDSITFDTIMIEIPPSDYPSNTIEFLLTLDGKNKLEHSDCATIAPDGLIYRIYDSGGIDYKIFYHEYEYVIKYNAFKDKIEERKKRKKRKKRK